MGRAVRMMIAALLALAPGAGRAAADPCDTGATVSILSMQTAARLGLHPGDPSVISGDIEHGVGQGGLRTWIAKVDSLKIGDEEIRHTRIRFGEVGEIGKQMYIGADFFRSHRVYAALARHRLYFAYRGGPVFDLTPRPAAGAAPAKSGAP